MKFSVEITELLKRTVPIESDTEDNALSNIQQQYKNEVIVLDSSDFTEVNFHVRKVGSDEY